MRPVLSFSAMSKDSPPSNQPKESPLSLSRLREAFAAMLGGETSGSEERGANDAAASRSRVSLKLGNGCEINPRSVVEALLFVGRPDSGAFSSRELAAAMRGVSPVEIDAAVQELNTLYDEDQAPYAIEGTNAGYRLVLRHEFQRMRDKFYGTVREAKLSPAALEVLSIIAYNQPVSTERINEIRNAPNGAAISTLVRRRIVRLDRSGEAGAKPHYSTTERFLKLFGLESLDALPRSEEVAGG
jgi:segregation and condensation protein B